MIYTHVLNGDGLGTRSPADDEVGTECELVGGVGEQPPRSRACQLATEREVGLKERAIGAKSSGGRAGQLALWRPRLRSCAGDPWACASLHRFLVQAPDRGALRDRLAERPLSFRKRVNSVVEHWQRCEHSQHLKRETHQMAVGLQPALHPIGAGRLPPPSLVSGQGEVGGNAKGPPRGPLLIPLNLPPPYTPEKSPWTLSPCAG